jgi:hypothetical protein
MKVSGTRKRKRRGGKRPEVLRYGRVKWVPVQQVEPVHDVRYESHLGRLIRSMRRRRSKGCMWNGRPLLVEPVRAGMRHAGIRWIAWTGSHRIAAAFAAGQWLVPIIEINVKLYDAVHGKPKKLHARLSETYDDESRLARLLPTGDKRAIRLMDREVPRDEKQRAYRKDRNKRLGKTDNHLWTSLGSLLEARAVSARYVDIRHKPTGDTYRFGKEVLQRTLAVLRAGVKSPRKLAKAA